MANCKGNAHGTCKCIGNVCGSTSMLRCLRTLTKVLCLELTSQAPAHRHFLLALASHNTWKDATLCRCNCSNSLWLSISFRRCCPNTLIVWPSLSKIAPRLPVRKKISILCEPCQIYQHLLLLSPTLKVANGCRGRSLPLLGSISQRMLFEDTFKPRRQLQIWVLRRIARDKKYCLLVWLCVTQLNGSLPA